MTTPPVPNQMKGIQIKGFGGTEVLQYKADLPVPVPQSNEILVKNDFTGVNYVDIYWRMGRMSFPPNGILGREGEGTIVALGPESTTNLSIGDRVVWLGMGGYAEYTAVPTTRAYKIPPEVPPGVAAAALLQGLTALTLTHRVCQVKKGDWVLVHAAAGGVGLWLCQILKSLGARVIATASTAAKLKLAEDNGAEFLINYADSGDIVREIMLITDGEGVDVVYDGIGKDQTENNVYVVADRGAIVTYGASSGIPAQVSHAVLAAKKVRFVGPGEAALMKYVGTPHEFEEWCGKLFDVITRGGFDVKIHDTYPLAEIARAHNDLEGRKTVGKVLLKP